MNLQILKSNRFYIPILSGYLMTLLCPMDNLSNSKDVPPPIVFSIVWPVLYLLLGYSWVCLENYKYTDTLFGLNMILGVLWIYNYSCKNKKNIALYILIIMIIGSIYLLLYSFQNKPEITYLLVPYTVWLVFATMLNLKSVSF